MPVGYARQGVVTEASSLNLDNKEPGFRHCGKGEKGRVREEGGVRKGEETTEGVKVDSSGTWGSL